MEKKKGDHGKLRREYGADYFKRMLNIEDGKFLFQIWEISPKSNEKNLSVYYSGASGGIIIFDKRKKESFANVPN